VGAENLDAFKHCSRTVLQSYGELHLEGTEDDIWNRHLSQKARNAVRSASKSGLRCEIHRGFNACQPPFYDLYLRSMKRLCVPPHTPRFFEALAAHLGEGLVSCWAYQGTQPVAVILGGITAPRLHCIIMASDERAWPLHPNDLIHWKLIEWALDQGIERLDLGSASSRKQLDFKRKWGAEMRDYAYLSINVSGQPETPESNREHVLQKKLWSLLPLRASSIIGPILRKRIY
jgi:lipid II:glycine glycyltransferase (peptidoglycan interpeptide bridge formation enzyme)